MMRHTMRDVEACFEHMLSFMFANQRSAGAGACRPIRCLGERRGGLIAASVRRRRRCIKRITDHLHVP
eukprot:5449292-Pleurochrysis_carterae.AAC.1